VSDVGLMPIKQARSCIMELIAGRIVDSQVFSLKVSPL